MMRLTLRTSLTAGALAAAAASVALLAADCRSKPGPAVATGRAQAIALAAATEKWPDWRAFHNSKLYGEKVLSAPVLTDGRFWRTNFRAHNGEAGHFADITIDAETGEVTEFKVLTTM